MQVRLLSCLLLALVASALAAGGGSIYPDDHWQYSTKLTNANFESWIKQQVDSGKTAMAPAWNAAVKKFAENPDVVFGDVSLRDDGYRGNHNPGQGGWPTIKYFNQETGYEGKTYNKKTSKSMCDELGPPGDMLQAYIEEAGKTSVDKSKCVATSGEGCAEKELKFIATMKKKGPAEVTKQLDRLAGMASKKMAPAAKAWINTRLGLLKQLAAAQEKEL